MDQTKTPAETPAKKTKTVVKAAVAAVATTAVAALLWWGFHGTAAAVLRWVAASTAAKVAIVAVGAVAAAAVAYRREYRADETLRDIRWARFTEPGEEDAVKASLRQARVVRNVATGVAAALVVGVVVAGVAGGQVRGVATAAATVRTDDHTADYGYRLPWVVASASAKSKAGAVVGVLSDADTTYLPGTGQYTTPVRQKSFSKGYSAVVVQEADGSSDTCEFTSPVPSDQGLFGMNLRRALSFVDMDLSYNAEDFWAYCDDTAKLVVPVTKFVGFPEGHRVPAGVVVFDGSSVVHLRNVEPGELPGPVYPMSLARAQRESLANLDGVWERLWKRAGYDTTTGEGGDPNSGNASELLLAGQDGTADFVTPLTPKGKSGSVIAVAVIDADHVESGVLNELVIHALAAPRDGNQTIDAQVRAAFPELGWAAGLRLAEVLPLNADTWTGTITTDRAAVHRVSIQADGTLCLQSIRGKTLKCSKGGVAAEDTSTGDAGIPSGDLVDLTDAELLELQRRVIDEVARRLNT